MGQAGPLSLKFNASFLLITVLRTHPLLSKMSSAQSRELSSVPIRSHRTLLCLSMISPICHRATAIPRRAPFPHPSLLVAKGALNGQAGLSETSDVVTVYKVVTIYKVRVS